MRVNVYAEELTDKIEVIEKQTPDGLFYGVRFYLELPVTMNKTAVLETGAQPHNIAGPFIHRPGDDDSSAITIWSRIGLRDLLVKAIDVIDNHHRIKQLNESGKGFKATTPV